MKHYSVLLNESIENLNIKEDGMYVDATMGYAGHSSNILKRIKKGFLFAFDNDSEAIKYADELLSKIGNNYQIFHTNFVNMKETLAKQNINRVDGILFDLGFSSPQIDDESRGFSFMSDSRLDMRMNQDQSLDAQKIVNDYSYEELVDIFFSYGEEKMSKVIAKKIIEKRKVKPIYSTLELVDIILERTTFIRITLKEKYFKQYELKLIMN